MIKKSFITGLVILLPLAVTLAVIGFIINLLTQPFIGMVSSFIARFNIANTGFLFLSPEQVLKYSSQIIILVLLFFLTVMLGMLTRWFVIHSLINFSHRIILRIPLVNTVYKTSRDIIERLMVSDKKSFQKVVMVAFPRPGTYVLGLVAREAPHVCSRTTGEELISVLVPTTPNPTTGFLLMLKKEELIHVDMKPEDAIKFILSCGVITPDSPALKIRPPA